MTGGESWFDSNDDSSIMFARVPDEVIPRISPKIPSKKAMITIVFTGIRLMRLVHLPQAQKCNQKYLIDKGLESITQEWNSGAGYRIAKATKIHIASCRVHDALET
jgi:hypothetical protein